jgi:hypothetical protein
MTTPEHPAPERYLREFTPTGSDAVDAILEAVAIASKGYHNTEQWCEAEDHGPAGYWSLIQQRANEAAALASHPAPDLRQAAVQAREALAEIDFAIRFAQESPPVEGPLRMMHHPLTVREFIHLRIASLDAALSAPPAQPKLVREQTDAEFVRMLLWDDFPECCGCPVADTGGEYMGQRETVMACCGNPEPAKLSDAQIVAMLRERFPEVAAAPLAQEQAGQMVSDAQVTVALRAACLHDTRESRKDMRKALEAALLSASPVQVAPKGEAIDMVLFCPKCGMQHIDAPDERTPNWKNEPHRSHLCHGCGHIWRPADVPTNGVAAVKTTGKADSPLATPARAIGTEQRDAQRYRWLRDQNTHADVYAVIAGEVQCPKEQWWGTYVDRAIDAAMGATPIAAPAGQPASFDAWAETDPVARAHADNSRDLSLIQHGWQGHLSAGQPATSSEAAPAPAETLDAAIDRALPALGEAARAALARRRSEQATASQQKPLAWGRRRFITDRDGRPIGTDDPELEWGSEPPDESGWFPLYGEAAPAPVVPTHTLIAEQSGAGLQWVADRSNTISAGAIRATLSADRAAAPVGLPAAQAVEVRKEVGHG